MCILQKVGSSMDLLYRFSTALLQARQRKDATQEHDECAAWLREQEDLSDMR